MGKSKHTPGPWNMDLYDVRGGADDLLATVWHFRTGREVADRNLSLIAAAPELLASLRELVERRERVAIATGQADRVDGSDGRYARAKAAIAKAEGR